MVSNSHPIGSTLPATQHCQGQLLDCGAPQTKEQPQGIV